MMEQIRAVLFDLDETLLDRTASIQVFLKEQYQRFGPHLAHIPFERYRERFLALDGCGYVPKDVVYGKLIEEFAITVPADQLLEDFHEYGWRACILFPGAVGLLQRLRMSGYKLAIITNGSIRSQQAKVLKSGLDRLVDQILISEEEGVRKPDPIIFRRACERLGVEPAACVFVGDNPEADVFGAHQVGMKAIWRKGHLPWPSALPVQACHTIGGLDELFDLDLSTL